MSNIQTLSTQDPPSIVMSPQSTHQWSAHGLLHRVWARLTQRTPFNAAQGLSLDRGLNAAQQESRERRLPSVELIKVGGVYHVHDRRDPIAHHGTELHERRIGDRADALAKRTAVIKTQVTRQA
ncbi:MAG: hypothetical protein HZY76_06715 [Anaerolineae bacterium]|nr:MAG: hypothetical protein HZY76_06715 [Anaerolineae bacterium]